MISHTGSIIIVGAVLVVAVAAFFLAIRPAHAPGSQEIAPEASVCTQDVYECPDGSFVRRTPPSCKFAECPVFETGVMELETKEVDTSDWQIYRNEEFGFEVRYPTDWETTHFKTEEQRLPRYPTELQIFSFAFQDIETKNRDPLDEKSLSVGFQRVYPSRFGSEQCQESYVVGEIIRECVVINGVVVARTTAVTPEFGDKYREIRFVHDGALYQIYTGFHGIPQEPSVEELSSSRFIVDDIISTFRFTR
jgi:hypothetical protein